MYVNKQEFSASSWRSNQGYTKMHGQPIIKKRWFFFIALRAFKNGPAFYHCIVYIFFII